MVSKRIQILFFLFFFSFCVGSAQSVNEVLEEKFISYIQNHPVEHTILNLPQKAYFTGDTMYMSGLVTNLFFRPSSEISKVVRVSILDNTGKHVQTLNFKNEKGVFTGKWYLPHTLKSGAYFFTAYTLYQDNFQESLSDYNEVYIHNIWDDEVHYHHSTDKSAFDLIPEGGNLVPGHNQKLIVSAPIQDDYAGQVLDKKGNQLSSFEVKSGYGVFFLTPEKGAEYLVEIRNSDSKKWQKSLVESDEKATLKVAKVGGQYFISVLARKNEPMYLVLESANRLISVTAVNLNESLTATFVVPASSFSGSFNTAAILDKNLSLISLRPFFVNQKKLSLARVDSVKTLSSINLDISSGEELTATLQVIKDGPLSNYVPLKKKLVKHYAMNTSEEVSIPISTMQTIDWMIGWTALFRDKWDSILKAESSKLSIETLPEIGIDIRGRVKPDSLRDKNINFYRWDIGVSYAIKVDELGNFYLPLPDFSDLVTFTYDLRDYRGALLDEEVTFRNVSIAPPVVDFVENQEIADQIKTQLDLKRVTAQYIDGQSEATSLLYDRLPYDLKYDMDDYVVLEKFNEIVVDILPTVSMRSIAGKKSIRISDPERELVYPNEPTVIINDVQLPNVSLLLELSPAYIAEIKIASKDNTVEPFGNLGASSGLIGIKLTEDAPKELIQRMANHNLSVAGYLKTAGKSEDVPDFRSVLYNSAIHIRGASTIPFSTSGEMGNYAIIIEGITDKGAVRSVSKSLEVLIETHQ